MVTSLVACLAHASSRRDLPTQLKLEITVAQDVRMTGGAAPDCNLHSIPHGSQMIDDLIPNQWIELALSHDVAIVIAPEIDLILPRIVAMLRNYGANLWNCEEPFLTQASDKLVTAELFSRSGIAHPATLRLDQLTTAWLDEHASPGPSVPRWVVKLRTGAGCEQLSVHTCWTREEIMHELADLYSVAWEGREAERFIIQPWISGKSFSCSAICQNRLIDWMPLMTQEFTENFKYAGGKFVDANQHSSPHELLERAVLSLGGCPLGWLGVDLVYSDVHQCWLVIEVNPRFTTSLVSLMGQPLLYERISRAICRDLMARRE